jgi:DNA (cytosine-5)-methyltransferase 1
MGAYNFIDLFAGCGGFSLGFLNAGMKGVFAIERDPMAFSTYSENLVDGRKNSFDCFDWPKWLERKEWNIEDLLDLHATNLAKLKGGVDVLIGGPPCQGFSLAGKRRGDDPRNYLFKYYAEVVKTVQPKIVVIENVPRMKRLHKTNSNKEAKESFYVRLVNILEDAGYVISSKILDASKFGVPQKRERLIAIGVRNDCQNKPRQSAETIFELMELKRISHLKRLKLENSITVSEAISDLRIYKRRPKNMISRGTINIMVH